MISEAYNRDCMEAMAEMPDKAFDLAIADVPYGINESRNVTARTRSVIQRNGRRTPMFALHVPKEWDRKPPTQEYFDELFRVCRGVMIFGENYFAFNQKPTSSGRIFWDKMNGESNYSDGEMIWTNVISSVRQVTFMWNGMLQGIAIDDSTGQGNKTLRERRIHPTQKPVALYKWLLTNYAKPGDKIFDSHLGSGSSRIAAYDLGFDFYGTELDKDYFDAQEKRFADHCAQPKLFVPETVTAEQGNLLEIVGD